MIYILDCTYLLAAIALAPMVLYRMITQKRYRIGWSQRFGYVNRLHPEKKCIWIHAVSLGEVNASKSLIDQMKNQLPQYEIIISTTTDTGYDRATKLFADEHYVFYFPFDFSAIRKHTFKKLNPSICILMELEVWPNFVHIAKKNDIPVVIVNGRITERSAARYARIKTIAKKIFSNLTLILAQTKEYAQRFKNIGVPDNRIVIIPSLKYDTAQVADKVDSADQLEQKLNLAENTILVAGGTGTDEEILLIDTYKKLLEKIDMPLLRFVIVPRKPERFDEVANLIKSKGFNIIRYSQIKQNLIATPTHNNNTIILGDTMGDLRKFYSIADLVYIGRSLVPMGGSDMIEAAALKKCCIFGTHTFNFAQSVQLLLDNNAAIQVQNTDQLLDAFQKCLTQTEYTRQMAENAQKNIIDNQGATQKTVEQIKNLLT